MGNLCSSCFKTRDDSETNANHNTNNSGLTSSQRSIASADDERTPLIGKSDGHNHQLSNGDSTMIAPLPPPPSVITDPRTDFSVPANETAESKMAIIVEGMLSKLIDVGSGGSNLPQTNNNSTHLNSENEQLIYSLNKSLSSTNISSLPDAGMNNLPSLLSGRPISSDICHFVAHTAGELSRLLIDEIKIIHKEDLVVVFE